MLAVVSKSRRGRKPTPFPKRPRCIYPLYDIGGRMRSVGDGGHREVRADDGWRGEEGLHHAREQVHSCGGRGEGTDGRGRSRFEFRPADTRLSSWYGSVH